MWSYKLAIEYKASKSIEQSLAIEISEIFTYAIIEIREQQGGTA